MSIMQQEIDFAQTIVNTLGLIKFIQSRREIYDKLIEYDTQTRKKDQGDLAFLAQSLPLIYAIINIGSTSQQYRAGIDCIKERLASKSQEVIGDETAKAVLSAFVFLFIVQQEMEHITSQLVDADSDTDKVELTNKQDAWEKVKERVEVLFKKQS